jgi:hypothetical protein
VEHVAVVGKTSARQACHSSLGCMPGRWDRETKRRRKGAVASVGNNRAVGRASSNQMAVGQADSSRMAAAEAGSSPADIHIPARGPDCPSRKAQAEKLTEAEAGGAFGPSEDLTAL